MKVDKVITEDEAALYDRQIRLWGVDAQKKYDNYFLFYLIK
jgi:molybdopterin/thiamine biosynthesis adenylyltransferase